MPNNKMHYNSRPQCQGNSALLYTACNNFRSAHVSDRGAVHLGMLNK